MFTDPMSEFSAPRHWITDPMSLVQGTDEDVHGPHERVLRPSVLDHGPDEDSHGGGEDLHGAQE